MQPNQLQLSLIIPVYNRPDEIEELLQSLLQQTNKDFEVVIVEDGSSDTCKEQVKKYEQQSNIQYFFKENTGPGISRNYGMERMSGNYAIVLDSDCIIPPHYIAAVHHNLKNNYADCFGGPDKAHESFSPLQKAINYALTSFFTTGGIRGGSEKMDKFFPRSFNMGISKEVFEATGGFPSARFAKAKAAGEDIELSIKIRELGYKIALYKDAYVYHKRRTSWKQFYRQVYNFGFARITLYKRNNQGLKLVHILPAFFTLGCFLLLILAIAASPLFLLPILLVAVVLFTDATIQTSSAKIGAMATAAGFIQLISYGLGFIASFWKQVVLKKEIG